MVKALAIAAVVVACAAFPQATGAAGPESPKSDRGVPPAAAKPVAPIGPKSTTAAFGDWVVACVAADAGPKAKSNCSMTQRLRKSEDGSDLALYRVTVGATDKEIRLMAIVPANVSLTDPPRLERGAEKEKVQPLVWRTCAVGGCVADVGLAVAAWRTMTARSAEGIHLTYLDSHAKIIRLPISVEGIDAALADVIRTSSP